MNARDKIEKLRRLAESPNPHEAARARQLAAELEQRLPAAPAGPGDAAAYPHQLPAAIRVPSSLKGGA